MVKLIWAALTGVLAVALILAIAPIAVAGGALAGWVVSLFFDGALTSALGSFGVRGIELWQLGALLGFLSVFVAVRRGS